MVTIQVVSGQGQAMHTSGEPSRSASVLHTREYAPGDSIQIDLDQAGLYCVIQLEDTLAPALVYAPGKRLVYPIPSGEERIVFSPKAFTGACHLIRARMAEPQEIRCRRNLAFNCYDRHGETGFYPHTSANVETRGEAVFASYNAVDGVYENASHGTWPYQSWGINRDPNAALTVDFGRRVTLDELRVTLRADFPHDSWWTQGTVEFSDGSREVLRFVKTAEPQSFPIAPRTVEWLVFKELIKAEDPSPFPALTQLEAWGTEA